MVDGVRRYQGFNSAQWLARHQVSGDSPATLQRFPLQQCLRDSVRLDLRPFSCDLLLASAARMPSEPSGWLLSGCRED